MSPDPDATGSSPVEPAADAAIVAAADAAGAPPADAPAELPILPQPPAPPRHPGAARGVAVAAGVLVAVLAGSALFLSGWSLGRQVAVTPGTPASEAAAFQPFWDTYRAVTERYAGGQVDRRTVIEGAIKGMIAALGDPYSMYLTPEEFKASLEGISGEFQGIGATIGTVDKAGNTATCTPLGPVCRMAIITPIKDAPAEKAGLQPGDVITKIDGASVDGQTLDQARGRVRGPKGTPVRLSIERTGNAPQVIEVIRDVIITPEVEAKPLAGGTVGYIKLSGFSDHAAEELDRAVADDVQAGRKNLVLDLRGNPGGFVTAARDIASQFLPDGTIFWQEDADGNLGETVAKPGGAATDPSIRLVVLVDGGSASAAEIVAGALHDRGRATLVGTKTFGKGTVQQWTQLEGDSGGFRLTIAKWLTPDKVWIHGKGIVPDVVVDAQPTRPGEDPVLDAGLKALGITASGETGWLVAA